MTGAQLQRYRKSVLGLTQQELAYALQCSVERIRTNEQKGDGIITDGLCKEVRDYAHDDRLIDRELHHD